MMAVHPANTPLATAFLILLAALLVILLIGWCCKQCTKNKSSLVEYTQPTNGHRRRYITAIDVQTGLPVVIHTSALNRGLQTQLLVAPPELVNNGRNTRDRTLYGTILYDQPQEEILSRSPPPPYSSVYIQPGV